MGLQNANEQKFYVKVYDENMDLIGMKDVTQVIRPTNVQEP